MKNLVIVESPAKAKTIEKFLGPDFKVMSSFGHIRDLKKHGLSVEVDDNFSPIYEIPDDKKELVKKLRSAAKAADTVWLASDEDREGEAIAWHLADVLGLDPASTRRIVFHEITKPAILKAIENPRHIDLNRVNAQQARRVLDRIVGFELSPVLWKKIKPSLSAGRVQSVAVRLICEREKEIEDFKSTSFYRVTALFTTTDGQQIRAEASKRFDSEKAAREFLSTCSGADFTVSDIQVKPITRKPAPPFTTSTLQQEAARKLGFSVNSTMRVAQKLYEAGLITYMRTDSTNLSSLALNDISRVITSSYGEDYLKVRRYHTHSKGAQEAHEAIRPTYVSNTEIDGDQQEQKLYRLIWRRAVASQMADARLEKTTADIRLKNATSDIPDALRAQGETVKFEGFMKVYDNPDAEANTDSDTTLLPALTVGEGLIPGPFTATERFTQAPARYNEASLVKKLEDLGIGRPSTYAPTISTIQARGYIRHGEKEGAPRDYNVITLSSGTISQKTLTEKAGSDRGRLVPTDTGLVVNEFLTQYFPSILDYNFTARIEQKFDEIAEGEFPWQNEMKSFYDDFHPLIDAADSMRLEHKVGERVLGTDPESGRRVSVKIGRFGPVVQIGEASDEEKPKFASLSENQSISTITLEEALKLFELPRVLGKFEEQDVKAAIGRFGPYVQIAREFVSIPKDLDPHTITLQQAVELIQAKREKAANAEIKTFPELPGVRVLRGRFGPYVAYLKDGAKKAVNYKIPKGTDPESLTAEEVTELMKAQDAAPKKTRPSRKK